MGPEDLREILSFLPPSEGAGALLVGLAAPDDAAVYQVSESQAVVATLDFFTPVVDDPADFGAIAAANAFSDLYAMGATPAFALSVLGFPAGELPMEVAGRILQGASEVCREAGVMIAGGHSIDDKEPKFGLVAIGLADPARLYRKQGARPGDVLVLGKALGTGIVATAIKREAAGPEVAEAAVRSMRQLNRAAAAALAGHEVHAATDVTGFGLLGHLREVCEASGVTAVVRASAPLRLAGAEELAAAGCVPGGTDSNRRALKAAVEWPTGATEVVQDLLCDPQTSGGLLAAVPSEEAEALRSEWSKAGYAASIIGRIDGLRAEDQPILIRVEE